MCPGGKAALQLVGMVSPRPRLFPCAEALVGALGWWPAGTPVRATLCPHSPVPSGHYDSTKVGVQTLLLSFLGNSLRKD